jgi:hypothetical protein
MDHNGCFSDKQDIQPITFKPDGIRPRLNVAT